MIKVERMRVPYDLHDKRLEQSLNDIAGDEFNKILFVTSESYYGGEVGYTIIYENTKPVWWYDDDI